MTLVGHGKGRKEVERERGMRLLRLKGQPRVDFRKQGKSGKVTGTLAGSGSDLETRYEHTSQPCAGTYAG